MDLKTLQQRLRELILSSSGEKPAVGKRLSRTLKYFPIETTINFSDGSAGRYTVMEVVAQDQPGLLLNAKIATYGERVEDVFFISNRDGEPVTDPEQRDCLTQRIRAALDLTDVETTQKVASL